MYDIAIVGFGATGVSLIKQIQDEIYSLNLDKPKIAIMNPLNSFATGHAFGDADSIHKVNTIPNLLPVSSYEPDSFYHWLKKNKIITDNYPARLQFSRFLSQLYHQINSADTLHITEFHSSATSIAKAKDKFVIEDSNHQIIHSKTVVMCLGAKSSDNFPQFSTQKGFIRHFKEYDDTDGKILIAGSSLTAIDAFRYAYSKGNQDINLFSRKGYLPTCISNSNQYHPVYLTWQNIIINTKKSGVILNTFIHLLNKEMGQLKVVGEFRQAMNLLQHGKHQDYFEFLLHRAQEGNLPCQDILVSTRPYMHKIWALMNIKQKQKFINTLGSIWAAWRHPVPQKVFEEIHEAIINNRLKFHKLISAPTFKKNKYIISTKKGTISSGTFWDATGGGNNLTLMKDGLLSSLKEKNLIEPCQSGGININVSTMECIVNNQAVKGLYNLGPLNKGCLFSTNAYWFNTQCANIVAKNIIRQLSLAEQKENI